VSGEALLLNPYQFYADRFIELLYREHGVRTVALHTDWRTRLIRQPRQPIFDSPAVSAHYMVPEQGIAALAPRLRHQHDIVAVLPHDEGAVAPLVSLGRALGLPWADQRVFDAIGSKSAVKALIRSADPGIRLNAVAGVTDAEDTIRWARDTGVARFVLKPDDGSGNRGVAFFDAEPIDEAALREYFAANPRRILAEEYIGGAEYWVNGQCDSAGAPLVTAMGVYDRRSLNGKENIEVGSRTIPRSHPAAPALAEYAIRVVAALGLRRSPFHLEAKVDEQGPCLIEVGTRLCGERMVATDSWQFGTDLIALAVSDYVSAGRTKNPPLDRERYDSLRIVSVNGAATRPDRIARIEGMAEVEQMAQFVMWIKKPKVGNAVVPTRDLMANPWSLYCWGADDEALDNATQQVHATLQLTGASQSTRFTDRWPLVKDRIARAWQARPRPAMARSWWDSRSL
jgi:biotin carboxylase